MLITECLCTLHVLMMQMCAEMHTWENASKLCECVIMSLLRHLVEVKKPTITVQCVKGALQYHECLVQNSLHLLPLKKQTQRIIAKSVGSDFITDLSFFCMML